MQIGLFYPNFSINLHSLRYNISQIIRWQKDVFTALANLVRSMFAFVKSTLDYAWKSVRQQSETIKILRDQNISTTKILVEQEESEILVEQEESDAEILVEQKEAVKMWLNIHRADYVAHAIWQDCVSSVIQDGVVAPSEEIFRTKKVVSYEQGAVFGSRAQSTLPVLSLEEINKIDIFMKENFLQVVPQQQEFEGEIFYRTGKTILGPWGSIFEEEYDIKKGGIYLKLYLYDINNMSVYQAFLNLLNMMAETHKCSRSQLAIAYDQAQPVEKQFDTQLSQIYESYENRKNENISLCRIRNTMKDVRSSLLNSTKLSNTIRTLHNQIHWNYGDVVVLRGNSQDVISHKSGPLGEAILLAPFQNKGKFFQLNLSHPDCFLIGPKKHLKPHKTSLENRNIKFQYIENLTPEELNIFKVPKYLHARP